MRNYLKNKILIIGTIFSIFIVPAALSADDIENQSNPEQVVPMGTSNEWETVLAAYLWGAGIDAKNSDDDNTHISFSDIIDNLDVAVMTSVGVRKDKLSLIADIIYLDLDNDSSLTEVDITMRAWISTMGVGYTLIETDKYMFDLVAGIRYLYLDIELGVPGETASDSDDTWDGIIALRGNVGITDKWSFDYYLDGGKGDSDFTTQAKASIYYRMESLTLGAGYRYLKWNFRDNAAVNSIVVKGPYAGASYKF